VFSCLRKINSFYLLTLSSICILCIDTSSYSMQSVIISASTDFIHMEWLISSNKLLLHVRFRFTRKQYHSAGSSIESSFEHWRTGVNLLGGILGVPAIYIYIYWQTQRQWYRWWIVMDNCFVRTHVSWFDIMNTIKIGRKEVKQCGRTLNAISDVPTA